ncbi:unnamed protein product [Calypogeia fissa]
MCRCSAMENSGTSTVREKTGRAMKKGTSKRWPPMLLFWICVVTAVFIILVCPILDPLSRVYMMASFNRPSISSDICSGKRIFMYDLPSRFNVNLFNKRRCNKGLISWMNLCPRFSNGGYGLKLWDDSQPEWIVNDGFDRSSWYDTDSYMLEVIFHMRMKEYHCLTGDPAMADAFFIPYYTGLHALVHLYPSNLTGWRTDPKTDPAVQLRRQNFGMELINWLEKDGGEKWRRYGGRDHFLILGRTAWDFQFQELWGTGFSELPFVDNMTRLLIERDTELPNEHAIPYPTSFHPSSPQRLSKWIEGVTNAERKFLFSYVGAPRPDIRTVRGVLETQCLNAGDEVCKMVNCSVVRCSHDPESIYRAFLQSTFCLQPRGDSNTRRSTFDCLISGAIPVFFHKESAYTQYSWHLPRDPKSYSVFISEEDLTTKGISIQKVLMSYSPERIRAMRKRIVSLIPSLIYNDYANDPLGSEKDAFEVSIAGVLDRIAAVKKRFPRAAVTI